MSNYNCIEWNKAYSLGHEKIDSEHKKLFDIAKRIQTCEKDSQTIVDIVKELVLYTKIHFNNEETYMKSISYENLGEHIKIHKSIIRNLDNIIKEMNTLELEEIINTISDFVYNSVLYHILVEDKKVHHRRKSREELKENFRWSIDYQVNQNLIDEEHKHLFEIAINALNYHNTDIKKHIRITINELYEYMKTHFEHEEAYMLQIAYPKLDEHIESHNHIIEEMNLFVKSLANLQIEEFERKLIEYMDIWLINHILFEDRKILSFVNAK